MESYHQAKIFFEHAAGIEHGTLHVVLGALAWLAIALLLRRPVSSWLPWLGLLALNIWNEMIDVWVEEWPRPEMQYGEGAKDMVLTMLVPTVIMIAVRVRPGLFKQPAKKPGAESPGQFGNEPNMDASNSTPQ